jgi:3-hydroxymyristoyl/3-hydroxydecanoyl-(acyl carrier protein) dehydratase
MSADAGAPFEAIVVADGAARATLRPAYAARLCAGHFPDAPLVPGSSLVGVMVEVATRLAGGGALVEIERCVFRSRVHPDATIVVDARLEGGDRVEVRAHAGGRLAARAWLRVAPGS